MAKEFTVFATRGGLSPSGSDGAHWTEGKAVAGHLSRLARVPYPVSRLGPNQVRWCERPQQKAPPFGEASGFQPWKLGSEKGGTDLINDSTILHEN